MSKFEDIEGGRLIYTCNCGWVDLGHANPAKASRPHIGAVALWEEIVGEKGTRSEYDNGFRVIYKQDMRKWGVTAAATGEYFVRFGLDEGTKKSIALTIFQEISIRFETIQGQFPWGIFSSDSSFSQEDLVSNLIGFYRAVNPKLDYLSLCKPVSKEASQEVWKNSGSVGSSKNRDFKPQFKGCKECVGKGVFPPELQTIKPAVKTERSSPPKKGVPVRDWSFEFDQKTEFDRVMDRALNSGSASLRGSY